MVNRLELKIPPLIQVLIITIVMWAFSFIFSTAVFAIPGHVWIALALAILGAGIAGLGVLAFHKAHTTIDPRTPNATSELVVSGIYQWSRNPMYLGFLLILTGWAMYLASIPALLLLPVFVLYMNRFQIEPEECFMTDKFGEMYKQYQTTVKRWL